MSSVGEGVGRRGGYTVSGDTGGCGGGKFRCPGGIAVDGSGNVYVAEWVNNRVQVFGASGEFLRKWGSRGSGDGQFQRPFGIAVDGSDNAHRELAEYPVRSLGRGARICARATCKDRNGWNGVSQLIFRPERWALASIIHEPCHAMPSSRLVTR